MPYLFTSESVSEGHPDKVADQISDALIDNFLAFDPESKVACETLVTTGLVVLAGEVKSKAYLDVQKIAREVINKIGYTKGEYMFDGSSCAVLSAIHEQSPDINQGVDRSAKEEQGAGDQGMMFGYATSETDNYMPLALDIAHALLIELAAVRRENSEIKYLRPDAKSQVTLEYDDNNQPIRIDAIVISTQHDDFDEEKAMLQKIIQLKLSKGVRKREKVALLRGHFALSPSAASSFDPLVTVGTQFLESVTKPLDFVMAYTVSFTFISLLSPETVLWLEATLGLVIIPLARSSIYRIMPS